MGTMQTKEVVDVRAKLLDTLKSIDTAMVATYSPDTRTMHARPMALAEIDGAGELWFITSKTSGKVEEARGDSHALVTAQSKLAFVSISGRIDVLVDPERTKTLWKESWKAWFPNGPTDANICLLRVRPEIGEYWDERGFSGLRYLFEAAKAIATGETIPEEAISRPDQHAKVAMH